MEDLESIVVGYLDTSYVLNVTDIAALNGLSFNCCGNAYKVEGYCNIFKCPSCKKVYKLMMKEVGRLKELDLSNKWVAGTPVMVIKDYEEGITGRKIVIKKGLVTRVLDDCKILPFDRETQVLIECDLSSEQLIDCEVLEKGEVITCAIPISVDCIERLV